MVWKSKGCRLNTGTAQERKIAISFGTCIDLKLLNANTIRNAIQMMRIFDADLDSVGRFEKWATSWQIKWKWIHV